MTGATLKCSGRKGSSPCTSTRGITTDGSSPPGPPFSLNLHRKRFETSQDQRVAITQAAGVGWQPDVRKLPHHSGDGGLALRSGQRCAQAVVGTEGKGQVADIRPGDVELFSVGEVG